MAFQVYKKSLAGEKVRYERVKPLKLSGREGLIARHVKSLRGEEGVSWKLSVAELLALAGFTGQDLTVLFDVGGRDATSICFYELMRLHGSCRDTSTNLALDMNVVCDRELEELQSDFGAAFETALPVPPKQLGEILSLTGGIGGGDWKWGKPSLQIGATVVNAHTHHGGGEPCPNCTCGRRTAAV
jgi:hypothetical protein